MLRLCAIGFRRQRRVASRWMTRAFFQAIAAAIGLTLGGMDPIGLAADDSVDFSRDIRPILSDRCFKCHGFDDHTREAIQRYFSYYRIDPSDAELPVCLLSHPLSMKIFCRVANPEREQVVGFERLPESLTGMLEH